MAKRSSSFMATAPDVGRNFSIAAWTAWRAVAAMDASDQKVAAGKRISFILSGKILADAGSL